MNDNKSNISHIDEAPQSTAQQLQRLQHALRSEIAKRRQLEINVQQLRADFSPPKPAAAETDCSKDREKFSRFYHQNPSIFFTLNEKGIIQSVNDFGAQRLGFLSEDLIDKSWLSLLSNKTKATSEKRLQKCLRNPDTAYSWESAIKLKDGMELWTKNSARLINANDNHELLMVCEDITKLRSLSEQLTYHATHDDLTGLINRRKFELRLNDLLVDSRNTGNDHALCYLDLDQFKIINDTCGHIAGDALLRNLAELLLRQVRDHDNVARLGGDEFGIVMENCSLEKASCIADRIRENIKSFRFIWDNQEFGIGVSIGLVPITITSGKTTDIMRAADAACYEAKSSGRDRVKEYRHDDTTIARRHDEMLCAIQVDRALEESRFRLVSQAIKPTDPGCADGEHYEILIRMWDDKGTLVSPATFLPVAEQFNQSVRVDQWVIHTVFKWLTDHPDHLHTLSLCSINLSGPSLADERFHEFLIGQFDETDVPPEKICFEVTETAAIANLARANKLISFLKALGCKFALDDFGSGLSSFGYLKSLPVDFLKIDGVFVKEIDKDPINRAIVHSINEIGHVLGKKTIAEYVENQEIRQILCEIGVDYVQGHGVGKPVPLDEEDIEAKLNDLT